MSIMPRACLSKLWWDPRVVCRRTVKSSNDENVHRDLSLCHGPNLIPKIQSFVTAFSLLEVALDSVTTPKFLASTG